MNELGNKAIMGKNIQFYMDLNNKTRNELCKDLKVSYSTLTDWIKGNTYPRIDKIEMLAKYFGISKAQLVESKDNLTEDEYYINPETAKLSKELYRNKELMMLIDAARDVSPEELITYAEFLKKLKKNKGK